jgi:rubrerythrin
VAKAFKDLTEREILALAIALEEDDGRTYGEFAEQMRADFPATATALLRLQVEESDHRHRLIDAYRARFGEHIPLIRRDEVKGFLKRKPIWQSRGWSLEKVRREIGSMEQETRRFYETAAASSSDAGVRQLLGDLAAEEIRHGEIAAELEQAHRTSGGPEREDLAKKRTFILQIVQPGLAGLMDGSVSTLAPVFAAAFATRSSWDAFLVGLAASLGAGISMGFAEALSDDGVLSGRGRPWIRGGICGLMTAAGGIGHTLPYLISNFRTATGIACGVVVVELAVISWIRHHFMDSPLLSAVWQVGLGGVLVFLTGIIIGSF